MWTIMTKQSAAQNLIRSEHLMKCRGVKLWTTGGNTCWVRFSRSIETYLRWTLHIIIHLLGIILNDCIIHRVAYGQYCTIRASTVCPASSNHVFSTVIPADWNVTHMNVRSAELFPLAKWRSVTDKRWPRVTASSMYLPTVEVTLLSIPSHVGPSNHTNNDVVVVCLTQH